MTAEPILEQFLAFARHPHAVFLDSAAGGRLSLLSAAPRAVFRCRGEEVEIHLADGRRQKFVAEPFGVLEDLLASHRDQAPQGAAIGYFGYELKNLVERLPQRARNDLGLPDAWFGFYDRILCFPHLPQSAPPPLPPQARLPLPASNFSREDYIAAVRRILEYIAAGDVYQVNLAQRFRAQTGSDAVTLYLALRQANPAPFAAFLDIGEAQILSSSPESFLRIEGRSITTRPIKGTRPRSGESDADAIAARELLMSAKDQAELLMTTDLLRNDLGRVCEFGSVRVPELVRLEEYATVFHLVSTIEGVLREGVSPVTALRACFPGGSITGAPKIRAMQIIDELEPHARGVYTGAIGYFGCDGVSHFNVAIRTMVKKGREVFFHAGGGVVADSDAAAEYDETLAKARGMVAALVRAQEESYAPVPR